MSKLMSPDALFLMANTLTDCMNSNYDACGFDFGKSEHRRVHSALSDCCEGEHMVRQKVALRLAMVNMDAYANTHTDILDPNFYSKNVSTKTLYRRNDAHEVKPWHYHFCKLLDFWIYQTEDCHQEFRRLRYGIIGMRDELCDFIVANSPEYRAHRWGDAQ